VELGYSEEESEEFGLAAVLHDIGKIQVPGGILNKADPLSEEEWAVMRQHTSWGADFLRGRRGFALAEIVAHSHHERWDGAGYPSGLTGDDISDAAQITCVADSFDAMTSDRPYRNGRSAGEAIKEIMACAGTQFSPRVAEALKRLHERGALLPENLVRQQAA
jgi:HD-GYP domain-containing protein (c-di-GMP phosphodiesterase class II)